METWRKMIMGEEAAVIAHAAWDPDNKTSGYFLSGDDKVASAAGAVVEQVRSTKQLLSGNYQWDVYVNSVVVGNLLIGLCHPTDDMTANAPAFWSVGNLGNAYYANNGKHIYLDVQTIYGAASTTSDFITAFYRVDDGEIYFAKNDIVQNSGDPVNQVNPAMSGIPAGMFSAIGTITSVSTLLSDPNDMLSTPRSGFIQGLPL